MKYIVSIFAVIIAILSGVFTDTAQADDSDKIMGKYECIDDDDQNGPVIFTYEYRREKIWQGGTGDFQVAGMPSSVDVNKIFKDSLQNIELIPNGRPIWGGSGVINRLDRIRCDRWNDPVDSDSSYGLELNCKIHGDYGVGYTDYMFSSDGSSMSFTETFSGSGSASCSKPLDY